MRIKFDCMNHWNNRIGYFGLAAGATAIHSHRSDGYGGIESYTRLGPLLLRCFIWWKYPK